MPEPTRSPEEAKASKPNYVDGSYLADASIRGVAGASDQYGQTLYGEESRAAAHARVDHPPQPTTYRVTIDPDSLTLVDTSPVWVAGVHTTGDIVQFAGTFYIAVDDTDATDTTSPAVDTTNWVALASPPSDDVELDPALTCDIWDEDTDYALGVSVQFGGVYFICIVAVESASGEDDPDTDTVRWLASTESPDAILDYTIDANQFVSEFLINYPPGS